MATPSMLLELFERDDFNVHKAVSYLKTYSSSIGITYFLVNKLAQFPEDEVEFYWPQICHLLITRPSESGALEGFVVKKCEESIHLAMLTLWQLQASLSDLSSNPNTPQFAICRRMYNRVQHIIFSDPLLESASDVQTAKQRITPGDRAIHAAIAGMSAILAALAIPSISQTTGKAAIEQGKRSRLAVSSSGGSSVIPVSPDIGYNNSESDDDRDREGEQGPVVVRAGRSIMAAKQSAQPLSERQNGMLKPGQALRTPIHLDDGPRKSSPKSARVRAKPTGPPSYMPGAPVSAIGNGWVPPPRSPVSSATFARHRSRNASNPLNTRSTDISRMHKMGHSQSMTSLPSPTAGSFAEAEMATNTSSPQRRQQQINGQTDGEHQPDESLDRRSLAMGLSRRLQHHSKDDMARPTRPNGISHTSPLPSHPYAASTSALNSPHAFQSRSDPAFAIPPPVLTSMLRSYACRSQLDLLTSLQDIATRLIVVPKIARLSALRAELTVLNHGLPRGCCLHMGCLGKGGSSRSATTSTGLHGTPLTTDSESIYTTTGKQQTHPHHRIVRISPSESVVLNSADRAPFLIHVEVLEDDLDFDPSRRQNAEDLRAVTTDRDSSYQGRQGRAAEVPNASSRPTSPPNNLSASSLGPPRPFGTARSPGPSRSPSGASSPYSRPTLHHQISGVSEIGELSLGDNDAGDVTPQPDSNEEVDLVEQMYGHFSVHDAVTLEVPDYQPQYNNRNVDEQAWRRAEARRSITTLPPGSAASPSEAIQKANGSSQKSARKTLTIDDYAERMRMAAIMLAQLNASQQLPMSGTDAVTGVVGAGLALPINLTYGVGSVVGSVVGVGVDVVRASFGGGRRDSISGVVEAIQKSSSEQASSGVTAPVDIGSAASGLSAVSGTVISAASTDTAAAGVRSPLLSASTAGGSSAGMSPSSSSASTLAAAAQHRARVLSPQEATAIRERIMNEMMSLEEERMARMRATTSRNRFNSDRNVQMNSGATVPESNKEDESVVMRAVNKEDPSGAMFKESWSDKRSRIRAASPYGHLASWDVFSVIIKTGADLRQEQLAVQVIKEFGRIWTETKCPHWIRYFRIMVTSESTGLLETITDAVSVHSIKKEAYAKIAATIAASTTPGGSSGYLPTFTLYDHFLETYGQPSSQAYRRAQDAFCKSLASYSIITYLLQIKDRHNGNILVDKAGHLMHIDFGFMLSNSPGSLGFEMAPFKLTQDYIDILGGIGSAKWNDWRDLLKKQFREIRQHAERIIAMIELMQSNSKLPCFNSGEATSQHLRDRFQLSLSSTQVDDFIDRLILSSAGSAFTRLYDTFQRHSQGVL